MKRLFSILLAVMLLLTLAVPAMAAEEQGTITVKNTIKDQTYSVYQMATLESYDTAKGLYSYKPASALWKAFFKTYTDYFDWDGEFILLKSDAVDEAKAAQLAKDALAYATANSIGAADSKTASADGVDVVFDGLALGYYLVDSSLGALCGLTTTKPTADVFEKNAKPDAVKEVEEDSSQTWGDTNDADLFQTVNFRTTVTVQKGAQNYVLHDKMDTGLTFGAISSVKIGENDVDAANYTVKTDAAVLTDGCTFEIVFKDAYVSALTAGTQIVVSYTAVLNENAAIGNEAGNKNETWLSYGDSNNTTHDITTTYTYAIDLVKTDASNTLLDGAEFKLYRGTDGTEAFSFLQDAEGYYVVAAGTEGAVQGLPVAGGKITVRGLDSDTYSLEEVTAPKGYNKLAGRKTFTISGGNLKAALGDDGKYASGGVQIINKTGSELPGTGGFGTTLFIVIGGVLVLAAGVVLFARKRLAKIAE